MAGSVERPDKSEVHRMKSVRIVEWAEPLEEARRIELVETGDLPRISRS